MSNVKQRRRRAIAFLGSVAIASLLAGCGGGSVRSSLPVSGGASNNNNTGNSGGTGGGSPASGTVRVPSAVKLHIPSKSVVAASRRGPLYVSTASAGIGISAYLANTPAPTSPQLVGALGPPYCVPQQDGSQSCSFPVPAPIGNDIIDVTLYDQAPTPLGVPQGHVLSHVAAPETIQQNGTNTLTLTMNGVVAAVRFSGGQWLVSGNTTEFAANVATLDASGNVIVGDPYAQPVALSVTGSGAPHLTIARGATLSSPLDNQVIVTWDGTPFADAAIALTVGGAPGTSAFSLPLPAAFAQIPITVPAGAHGDLALGMDSNSQLGDVLFNAGFLVVPGTRPLPGLADPSFFYLARNEDMDSDLFVAALPDNSIAAVYNAAYLTFGNQSSSEAVEVDIAYSHATTQLDPIGHTFFTDMCYLEGATGDDAGNLAILGEITSGCGVPPGTSVAITLDAARHRPLGRRPSGRRHTLDSGPFYTIEVFASPNSLTPFVGALPTRRIIDPNLAYARYTFAADPQGRFYAIDTNGGTFIDVYDTTAYNGATARIPVQSSTGQAQALAVDKLGRVAVLFNAEGAQSSIQLYPPYPGLADAAPLATVTWNTKTFGSVTPYAIAFDRFNNLWVVGNTDGPAALYALPPFPVTVPPGYTATPGSLTSINNAFYAMAAFPQPLSQTQPILPTPSPSPSPAP